VSLPAPIDLTLGISKLDVESFGTNIMLMADDLIVRSSYGVVGLVLSLQRCNEEGQAWLAA